MGPGTVAVRKATPVDKTPNNTTGAQEYNQLLIQQITWKDGASGSRPNSGFYTIGTEIAVTADCAF